MKKSLIAMMLLLISIFLIGCSDQSVDVNINVTIEHWEWQEIPWYEATDDEVNPFSADFVFAPVKIEDVDVESTYSITYVEELVSPLQTFPYEVELIEKKLFQYQNLVQELFDELAEMESFGTTALNYQMLGHRSRLEIHLSDETSEFIISFWVFDEMEIEGSVLVEYIGSDGWTSGYRFYEELSKIYPMVYELL